MNPFSLHILLYHDVAADDETAAHCTCPRFTTTAARLKEHLDTIRETGLGVARMDESLAWYREGRFPGGGGTSCSRSDGPHVGWFRHLIPMLQEYGMPATFFITAGWVGERHRYPESPQSVVDRRAHDRRVPGPARLQAVRTWESFHVAPDA